MLFNQNSLIQLCSPTKGTTTHPLQTNIANYCQNWPMCQFCENTLNIIYITPTSNEGNNLHIPFRQDRIRMNSNFM